MSLLRSSSSSNSILPRRGYHLPLELILLTCTQPISVLAQQKKDPPINTDEAAARLKQAYDLYHLPYGTLGMISHAAMLWVMICHLTGRSPAMPWKKLTLDPSKRWLQLLNLAIIFISSIVTISLAAAGLPVVKESRALTGMAVMQIIYSLLVDGIVVHRHFRDKPRYRDSNTETYRYDTHAVTTKKDVLEEREGLRWDLTPWLFALMIASVVNAQLLGTLNDIDKNPKLDGVTAYNNSTTHRDPAGIAFVILGIVGAALGTLAFIGKCVVGGLFSKGGFRSDNGVRYSSPLVYVFACFGLACCIGFIMAADYAVGIVTENSIGKPRGNSVAKFWTFFVFQFVPIFTF